MPQEKPKKKKKPVVVGNVRLRKEYASDEVADFKRETPFTTSEAGDRKRFLYAEIDYRVADTKRRQAEYVSRRRAKEEGPRKSKPISRPKPPIK